MSEIDGRRLLKQMQDDYEEGSMLPALHVGEMIAPTVTYYARTCAYCRTWSNRPVISSCPNCGAPT